MKPDLREHPVAVESAEELCRMITDLSAEHSKLVLITDTESAKYCYPDIADGIPAHLKIELPSGEEHKNLRTCEMVWEKMNKAGTDRNSLVINLGGGVVGDMGGFCAATYKRGISYVQVPTTLLAQVDASVGGKLGVDFQGLKNMVGCFGKPEAVLIRPSFLHTLPTRELLSGYAEVLKHGLLKGGSIWEKLLSTDFKKPPKTEDVMASVQIKADIVAQDPLESGIRKALNFGHTIGHALETFFLNSDKYKRILHGEAVALGIICESYLSTQKCGLPAEAFREISSLLSRFFPKVEWEASDEAYILENAKHDKKNSGTIIRCVLLEQIGSPKIDVEVSEQEFLDMLRMYRENYPNKN